MLQADQASTRSSAQTRPVNGTPPSAAAASSRSAAKRGAPSGRKPRVSEKLVGAVLRGEGLAPSRVRTLRSRMEDLEFVIHALGQMASIAEKLVEDQIGRTKESQFVERLDGGCWRFTLTGWEIERALFALGHVVDMTKDVEEFYLAAMEAEDGADAPAGG